MPSGEKSVIGLIGALYESAASPDRWEDFLRLVAQRMDCATAVLTVHDDRLGNWALQKNYGLPPEAIEEYNTHYGALNPTIGPLFEAARKTGSWHGRARSLTGQSKYKRSEYYNEFGRKYGTYWGLMGAIVPSAHAMITLSVVRPEEKPAPEPEAVELMGLLMPHFTSVIRIHRSMESLHSMTNAAVTAVDTVEAAVVAVDGDGRVLLTNGAAEKILCDEDGIILSQNQLSAENPHEARKLEFLIRSAAATGAGKGMHPGGSLLIHRRALRPFQIFVVPFHSNCLLADDSPCALIFIGDPDAQPASRAAVLSSLYELTPSECRLADLLFQGLELKAAAESLRITPGTARFVLKSIFRKTGTHRQSDLIRFLHRLPRLEANLSRRYAPGIRGSHSSLASLRTSARHG